MGKLIKQKELKRPEDAEPCCCRFKGDVWAVVSMYVNECVRREIDIKIDRDRERERNLEKERREKEMKLLWERQREIALK